MPTLKKWIEDAKFHYGNRRPPWLLLRMLVNPSMVAVLLIRIACGPSRILRMMARWALITQFGCDVASGAIVRGPIDLPHPLGVVIGKGVVIGERVRIYQNVTLGSSRDGSYPIVMDDVVLYANAVVVGRIRVNSRTTVGANVLLTRSTSPGETIRMST